MTRRQNDGALARRAGPLLALTVAVLLLLTGCQAVSGAGAPATVDSGLTTYAAEKELILAAATEERVMAVETIAAAGTRIARLSAVNAALGATLRANQTGTPTVRAVVVSAEDMGDAIADGMSDAAGGSALESAMRVSDIATAARIDPDSGCPSRTVTRFSPNSERIYVTARVKALRSGALFEVDWQLDSRTLNRVSWLADFSRASVCVWFYATPLDFPFAPGSYRALLYVDGELFGATEFEITQG